jgi:hypothetical protein
LPEAGGALRAEAGVLPSARGAPGLAAEGPMRELKRARRERYAGDRPPLIASARSGQPSACSKSTSASHSRCVGDSHPTLGSTRVRSRRLSSDRLAGEGLLSTRGRLNIPLLGLRPVPAEVDTYAGRVLEPEVRPPFASGEAQREPTTATAATRTGPSRSGMTYRDIEHSHVPLAIERTDRPPVIVEVEIIEFPDGGTACLGWFSLTTARGWRSRVRPERTVPPRPPAGSVPRTGTTKHWPADHHVASRHLDRETRLADAFGRPRSRRSRRSPRGVGGWLNRAKPLGACSQDLHRRARGPSNQARDRFTTAVIGLPSERDCR